MLAANRFNRLTQDWCEKVSRVTWLDLNMDLLGQNGLPMFRYYQPDLVHLNASGYAVWAQPLKAALGLGQMADRAER